MNFNEAFKTGWGATKKYAAPVSLVAAPLGIGAAVGARAFTHAPADISGDDRSDRASAMAVDTTVGAGVAVAAGAAAYKMGAFSKENMSRAGKFVTAAGKSVGQRGMRAAKGVPGVVERFKALPKATGGQKLLNKSAIAGAAVVGAAVLGAAAHSLTHGVQESSYAETSDGGETFYSESPLRRRLNTMGASGDMVFGLHNARRG